MTTITVPRATWNAMREALVAAGNFISPYSRGEQALEKVDAALSAANAVSAEPQAQREIEEWLDANRMQKIGSLHHELVARFVAHPQATEPASCHQTGVCVQSGLAAENHARLIECARRLVEHADFNLGGILSADSKAKDIPSKAVSQVKSRHLAALRDALPAAPEAKQ